MLQFTDSSLFTAKSILIYNGIKMFSLMLVTYVYVCLMSAKGSGLIEIKTRHNRLNITSRTEL